MAHTPAKPQVTTGPLPGSTKIFVQGARHPQIRVPMRSIAQTPTTAGLPAGADPRPNPPIAVYDTSGPYTDASPI